MEQRLRLDKVETVEAPATGPARRRRVGILGAALRLGVAVAIAAGAAYVAWQMVASRPEPVTRGGFERSFTVSVLDPAPGDFTTTVQSYGEVVTGTRLEVRAGVGGRITEISPNLRAGSTVAAGEVLARIDPYDYELDLANARNDLAVARLSLTEAEEQRDNLRENVAFAEEQLAVAQSDLERARTLVERGSLTSQELESRELVVSQRRQTLQQSRTELQLQNTAIARSQVDIERAERAVNQAERTLADTTVSAPFDAVVVSSAVVVGGDVGANEAIATLYDVRDLEVRFTLPERDYGRLVGEGLMGRQVRARWDIDPAPVELTGTVTRAGAEVDPSLGGVEVYARLDDAADTLIRPGTFVAVALDGPTYEDAYRIPETALYENDRFYVIADGRMQSVEATVRARDGSHVIVAAEVPEGTRIITTRLAQAGDGVRVDVEGEEPEPGSGEGPVRRGPGGGGVVVRGPGG